MREGARLRAVAYGLLLVWVVKNPREMLTAGLGGVAATGVDVALLVLMVESGVSVPAAAFFAACAGAAVNFVWNKYIAFRDRSPISIQQPLRLQARWTLPSVVTV